MKRFQINKKFKALIILGWIFCVGGCSPDKWDVDVSTIDLDMEVMRFEKDLFQIPRDSGYVYGVDSVCHQYGEFFNLFSNRIINIGSYSAPGFYNNLNGFISDPDMLALYGDCMNDFGDLDKISHDLTQGFKHYKYYFPNKQIPDVISFISGFNNTIIATDTILAFGLDMYMGRSYPYYQMLQLPLFKRRVMTPDHIVSDCILGWVMSDYVLDETEDLISQMVYHGKLMYLMNAFMPASHDSLILGFSGAQLEWCKANEPQLWAFFVKNDILYSKDQQEIRKYIKEAPFTTGFSKESPGRTGWWLGWQIVDAYMDAHSEASLPALMEINDAHKLLRRSGYKPKW